MKSTRAECRLRDPPSLRKRSAPPLSDLWIYRNRFLPLLFFRRFNSPTVFLVGSVTISFFLNSRSQRVSCFFVLARPIAHYGLCQLVVVVVVASRRPLLRRIVPGGAIVLFRKKCLDGKKEKRGERNPIQVREETQRVKFKQSYRLLARGGRCGLLPRAAKDFTSIALRS